MISNNYNYILSTIFFLSSITFSYAQKIPDFINSEDLKNVKFKCLKESEVYSEKEQKYIDILWKESLQYLEAYAVALTTSPAGSSCIDSDVATYETVDGISNLCVMERRDMQLMVKNIYYPAQSCGCKSLLRCKRQC
ncbi:hypothetical protein [uncultured Christiangramia sp.]|uniref:hypothetical protein n=1 Tax=uncultured Christiangramia sp. TaxID=503836 RepID=UPI00260D7F2B|nr:hypothetical protein [uncultured Christiangramia sp.]